MPFFVSPQFKRQGVGGALFEWAKSQCNGAVNLKTLQENAESRAFYETLGMSECGQCTNDFNGKVEIKYVL